MLETYYVFRADANKRQDRQQKQLVLVRVRFLALTFFQRCFNLGVLRLAAVEGAVYNWSGLDAHIFPPNKQHNFSLHDVFVIVFVFV